MSNKEKNLIDKIQELEEKIQELNEKLFYYEGAICNECGYKHCIDDSECPSCGVI